MGGDVNFNSTLPRSQLKCLYESLQATPNAISFYGSAYPLLLNSHHSEWRERERESGEKEIEVNANAKQDERKLKIS